MANETENQIVVYQPNETIRLDVRLENETVWLTQEQMCQLFQRDRSVITKHVRNVFSEGECDEMNNVQILHINQRGRPLALYSLDVIISVGYRVKSLIGTQFRRWATQILKNHLLHGQALIQRMNVIEDRLDRRLAKTEADVVELKDKVDFCGKLKELHKAYLRIELAHGGRKRALSAADVMDDEARNAAGERARVLNEIERLSGICGSVTKAVKTMRGGTYSARMKGVSDATWRKYYYDWQSAKRRRQLLKHSRPKMIGDGINASDDGINVVSDGLNDGIKHTVDGINLTSDGIKSKDGAVKMLFEVFSLNPGRRVSELTALIDRSKPTVERYVQELKKSGKIEYRGSKKTGGYYAIAESAPEQR
jgi:predicted transcriptional regulator